MFWDNENDSAWTQRWKNALFLKWWVRNDTRDAVLPWVVLAALLLLVLVVLPGCSEYARVCEGRLVDGARIELAASALRTRPFGQIP